MRNLIVSNFKDFNIPGLNVLEKSNDLLVVDHIGKTIIVHSGGIVYRFFTEDESLVELFRVDQYYPNEDGAPPSIVSMCYFQLTDSLCLAVDKGELLSLNCSAQQEVECVGFVESGLRLMEASPDEDVLVLLTCQNTVITMTASFDPISETDLQQTEFGENQFITVGWGKKETQFHGSEGKAAALAKHSVQSSEPSKFDDGSPQITWRGDGALFAVNCVNAASAERFVRIFDRKGDLMYTSEHIPGLEGVVSWRPSGNLMACSQRLPNKHVVCFLEKNGLRHGDFTLPFSIDSVLVRQLLWNAESTILLVWCQTADGVSSPAAGLVEGQSTLLLWTVNNYHWYLKQRIDLHVDNSPVAVRWDPDSVNRLHVICSGGKYISYDFQWRVDHSTGSNRNDGAFVSVIDGDSLLVTSFRSNVIPPPMCGTTLKLPAPAKEIVFAPQQIPTSMIKELEGRYLNTSSTEDSGFGDVVESLSSSPNNFCAVLSNGTLAAFSYVGGPRSPNPSHSLAGIYQLAWQNENEVIPINHLHHWTWVSRDTMVCSASVGNQSQLCIFDIDSLGSTDNMRVVLRKTIALAGNVISIVAGTEGNTVILQLVEGRVLSFSLETDSLSEMFTFPHPVYKMIACKVDKDCGLGLEVIFGLSSHNRLYANTDLVMGSVTSFSLHSQFLLFTTSQQQLFCCQLKRTSLQYLSKPSNDNGSSGVVERKVERGSRLVVVVPDGNRVILQMPRGNLECIEPRALSLSQMANLLNTQAYHEAFDLARKQRINLNLFVDHDPDLFLRNIEIFVKRVSNPQWLCLFLADLHDEDCTTTMYKSHYPDRTSFSLSNKVNTVCDEFLAAVKKMNESDSDRLTLPVLTALVLKHTSDGLEAALSLIKSLKESEEKPGSSVSWTVALRHLLYLRDVNQLMDAALGMYDFNLVVLVASKSQKDPKEYLSFLNKLRQMEENYQRYSIDKHLRKWESALVHLIKSPGDHKLELLNFVVNQDLFREALSALPSNDERFRIIASAYADKLVSQRQYKSAAVMYRRASDFHNALLSHQKALAWRNCIQDADSIGLNDDERQEILSELASALTETGQFEEAALLYQHYLNQPLLAVQTLCSGHLWTEAQRVASYLKVNESIETVIHPCALDYADVMSVQIKSLSDTFNTNTSRLLEVRREKQLARERMDAQEGDADGCADNDLLSDTSSMTGSSISSRGSSSHSSSSNRSSKNRRKQERKVLSLKKGSPHEELALMYALHQNITSTFAVREEVLSLNCVLVDFGDDCVARDLQNLLSRTLSVMEANFTKIWPPQLGQLNANTQSFGPNATSNMLASTITSSITNSLDMSLLEPTYRFAPVIRLVKWELDVLKPIRK